MKTNKPAHPQHGVDSTSRPASSKWLRVVLWSIVAISLFMVCYPPLQSAIQTRRGLPAPSGPQDAHEFSAVLFQRPTQADGQKAAYTKANLVEQLEVLIANGYQPIRVDAIERLVQRGSPLPRNALLVAVDGRDAALLQDLEDVTRKRRWGGLVLMATDPVGDSPPAASWNDLRDLQNTQRWDIGTYGHQGHTPGPLDDADTIGNAMTHRLWLPDENRLETTEESAMRILRDHELAAQWFDAQLGTLPDVYAFPHGDVGQFAPLSSSLARLNATMVPSMYSLAFVAGATGRNTRFTPAWHLNLLPVNPAWSSQQLIDEIQRGAQPFFQVYDAGGAESFEPGWITDWGQVSLDLPGIMIRPAGHADGGRVWIEGSELMRDIRASVRLRASQGGVRFLLRAAPRSAAGVYVDFYRSGTVEVWEHTANGQPPQLRARAKASLLQEVEHTVTITFRANALNVEVDGIRMFPRTIRVAASRQAGRFGVALFDTQANPDAFLHIQKATLQEPRETLLSWTLSEQAEPYLVDFIHRHGSTITKLSPQLLLPGSAQAASGHQELLEKLAGVYHLDLIPKIEIATRDEMRAWTSDTIALAARERSHRGVYVSFQQYEDLAIPQLDEWLRPVDRLLRDIGKPLLIRLPQALEQLASINSILAVMPAIQIVTGPEVRVPSFGRLQQSTQEQTLTEPSREERNSIPPAPTIPPEAPPAQAESLQDQMAELAAQGEQAFARGAFEIAIAYFSDWHDLAPTQPRPLRRIGDALVNLGYHDEATGFYRQALDLAPEDIALASRLARIFLQTGRPAASRSLLNIYARLFPRNTDILLTQAEWLLQQNRHMEAGERIQQIETLDPDNFDAILFQLRLAEEDETRKAALARLVRISRQPANQRRLIEAIETHDLLSLQSAYLLGALMNELYQETQNPELKRMIASMEPRKATLAVDFSQERGLPDGWDLDGGSTTHTDDRLLLQANPARTRMVGQLKRSERWRDSFIEIAFADIKGGLWLHARQNRNQMVRMGFEPSQDRLHLQIWGGAENTILESQFIPWSPAATGSVMRLEVRGKGVIGYVDAEPIFASALLLPETFDFGKTAFAVDASIRGEAEVSIRRIASGPLPLRAAIVPQAPPSGDAPEALDRLHAALRFLTDISPDWYRVLPTGAWESQTHPEGDFHRIFARYYRLRLTPVVKVASQATIIPDDIITICRTHGYDGLLLWFTQMPDEAWFEDATRAVAQSDLDIIAMAGRPAGATVRGIAGNSDLFPRRSPANKLHIRNVQTEEQWETSQSELRTSTPAVLLF